MPRILVVDDEPSILSVLSTLLRQQEYEVEPVLGGQKAVEVLGQQSYDLMISDIRMSPVDGMELLRTARDLRPEMGVMMVTAYGSVETAVEAMKLGAYDYVTKPFKVDELLMTVQRALEYYGLRRENEELKGQLNNRPKFGNMVAASPAMRRICDMVAKVAPTDQTVMVGGESGRGKEVVAKSIHSLSVRKKKPFIAINCAALPEPLLESELFGHVKGAFTGASSDKKGLFEEAHEGTIFLDEIGSMPQSLQGKLLRVLQEREVRRVGGNKTVSVDVRVIAASNENLEAMIADNTFREDLFYRLSVIPFVIPPLRERREDVLPLVEFFLKQIYGREGELPGLDGSVQEAMENYAWPGNVRELENAVRHSATFCRDGMIQMEDLPVRIINNLGVAPAGGGGGGTSDAYEGKSLKVYLRQKEKDYLGQVIEHFDGDKDAAAKAMKISLATLYRKLPESEE